MPNIMYRNATLNEASQISEMIMTVFNQFIAPDFSAQGIKTFKEYTTPQAISERIKNDNYLTIIAKIQNKIIAIMEIRNANHISLLFVESSFQKQGIAKQLIANNFPEYLRKITLQSAPSAIKIYEKLGFVKVGEEFDEDGMRQQLMIKSI